MVRNYGFLPKKWLDDTTIFSHFIEQHINDRNSIAMMFQEKVVGFLAYDVFNFHNEKTAFFPIMAHAADASYKLSVYSMMYAYISQKLVENRCINHLFTFFSLDQALQEYLFELGFGLYVVDAYRGLNNISIEVKDHGIVVRKAGISDVDELFGLVKESDRYYAEPPLFLKRESEDTDQILEMITSNDSEVFLAVRNDEIIGFMNIRCNQTDEVIILSDTTTACIDPIGAYIKKDYRGLGVGKRLLHESIAWSGQQDITNIHVDFESANYHANQFWLNYFTPILYSVKRRLNNDVI
ncbi:MAG: GNAT family N-acetyltransferase [Planctomycetes bacterium]|nr:GNAT family N-acetyltransferase [Planctomycetota bacterium]